MTSIDGPVGADWPPAGGDVGRLLRVPGFEAMGLGPVGAWPAALRTHVETMLASRQSMYVAWGPDLAFLYNDAYVPIFPERHPGALGRPFSEVWSDVWAQFGGTVASVLAGEPVLFENLPIPMMRAGHLVDTWFTFSFTPLRGDGGAIDGLLCITTEVTEGVLAARREREALSTLKARTDALATVNRAGVAITSELDVGRVAQTTADAGVALTGAEFGAFFYNTKDERAEGCRLYALSGADPDTFARFPKPWNTALFAPAFSGETVVRADDVARDPRSGLNAPEAGLPDGDFPMRSYLAVPVKSRSGEGIGALLFGHSEPRWFDVTAEASLLSLAGQAAVAIDNARLFAELERQLRHRARAEDQLRQLNETLEAKVASEIADRRLAERALQQAQKMETIGKLTGGVAHDFNNLLQVISGNLQLLTKDLEGNERAERRLANALAGVSRGAKLASQLLAFGRRQPLAPKVVNVGRLIAGMDDMLRRSIGESIEIETIASADLWNTLIDPTQIETAILNLAINARDAMDGAGKLMIEAGNVVLDADYARRHDEATPGEYVMVAVSDTGSGMTPEVLEQVFEPFFSTKPEGKGTGLGLSMVYGFVKQSGGHIKLYSEPGLGTAVKLYLPRADEVEDVRAVPDATPARGGTETILVAEDDEEVRATVVETLADLGYHVLTAKDAASALSVVESGVPIDLLFTDVVMPGPLKSPELARRARLRLPNLAVLFTSGYTENSIVHGGRLDAGVELLSKPYAREALARKIRHVLANQAQRAQAVESVTAPDTTATEPAGAVADAAPLTVLLVEDDPVIRANAAEMLQGLGHIVVEAGSAEEADAALQTMPVDVLMTDLGLPGVSGGAFAARARELRPGVGVIFATGSDVAPEVDGEAPLLLRKPYDAEALKAALAAARPAVAGPAQAATALVPQS
ncbi:response regulator [Methylopila sp. Yamaguchi]|uniref:response regulator n=1 Tax=Methylopila sp. Yamaguchi TaxID=1437817 RepID=UPI000CB5FC6E|nr:response regulator [Methylopila sp. Yamaguchi]GBD49897.1 multi-sensor hybrid histidine kinase [Methylopila sp. Yamaguchi]